MATYLKRSSKIFEGLITVKNSSSANSTQNNNRQITELSLRDVICPVCRTILREPVTLPCTHNLCLRCLRGTVEHNSLTCPLCRQRVGSWLRNATKTESLINVEFWQFIRRKFPEELALVAGEVSSNGIDGADLELRSEFSTNKILSAAGEIRREYEVQLRMAEEEMCRQREKERLASEAFIRKIQEEEEQQKLVQLAQDQLLAKTLAKKEVFENSNKKFVSYNKSKTLSLRSKLDINYSKSIIDQKMSIKSNEIIDVGKQDTALIPKIESDIYTSSINTSLINLNKESSQTVSSQKSVSIHNAVTRIMTHQNRISQSNNSTQSMVLRDFIASTSNIYGLQSKEELNVPNDLLNNKKKKLGVEICIGTIDDEERIGSAESAGSHDSINQEIHHFKPIKALPRTPFRITLDGRQIDPKLVRVLPILKRVSNTIPKPPTPTHFKKMFGCSWSAFKRISRRQQVMLKESHNAYQHEKKPEQSRNIKFNKSLQELNVRNAEISFDKNKNYTKSIDKTINGTKLNKKFTCDSNQTINDNSAKQNNQVKSIKSGLLFNKNKNYKKTNIHKMIEIVEIDDDENNLEYVYTPDPLALTPKVETRPSSPVLELAMENIAERIKRRKMMKTSNNTENTQSVLNLIAAGEQLTKSKSKKISSKSKKQKIKKMSTTIVIKSNKTKMRTVTTVTNHIRRLAARSIKRSRYVEEIQEEKDKKNNCEQGELVMNKGMEVNRSNIDFPHFAHPKSSRRSVKKKRTKMTISETLNLDDNEDETIIREQQRLEQLAAQEREDRELAVRLQARFNAMERIAGRTRRRAASIPSPLLNEPID